MSDLLTHWAFFDDARRFLRHDDQIEPLLLEILNESNGVARLGALARGGPWWCERILRAARENPQSDDPRWRQKLGFGLGGLIHFPADYEFKTADRRHDDQNRAEQTRSLGLLRLSLFSPPSTGKAKRNVHALFTGV